MLAPKLKVSITLAPDIVADVDAEARRIPGATRSSVVESWLRRGRRARADAVLRDSVVAYYEARTAEDRAEDEAIARATSSRSRRVSYE
jgi:hypothetical protein